MRFRRTLRRVLSLAVVLGTAPTVSCGGPANGAAQSYDFTARQLAGQRVIYSYPGLEPPASLFQRIRAGEAAGVIFFGENISSRDQIASVVQRLRAAAAESPVSESLLLMTDQEGGQVRRLPGEPVLSHKDVGESADPEAAATDAGNGAGENLLGVGMNVNLAPVLDVYREPGDLMDQYERSFGMDPDLVGRLATNFVRAHQDTGVAATIKHFPGLGSASADENTDLRPVTLPVPLSTLRTVDESPYQPAIAAGAKLVMLSWATYPALDDSRPAGLSPTVVRDELRGHQNFTGVTITDALEAGALDGFGSTRERAVLSAKAGVDLILASARNVTQGDAAVDGLTAALADGTLDQEEFNQSVERILALRAGLP